MSEDDNRTVGGCAIFVFFVVLFIVWGLGANLVLALGIAMLVSALSGVHVARHIKRKYKDRP